MPHSTISNHGEKPFNVSVIANKDDVKLDIESFDLSKDTKFTIRALLSYCLFIIAVYFFNLKFKIVGLGYVDSSTNMINLAELSIFLIAIHIIILVVYLWRDRINLKSKEIKLKNEINLYEKIDKMESSLIISFANNEVQKVIEDLDDNIRKNDRDFIVINSLSSTIKGDIQQTHASIKQSLVSKGKVKVKNQFYNFDDFRKKLQESPSSLINILKPIEESINTQNIITKDKLDNYKSINKNSKLVMWGINVAYPMLTSAFCIVILFSSLNELSKGVTINKDSYKVFKFIAEEENK